MKKNWTVIVESLVVGILVFLLSVFNLLSPVDYMLRDRMYQMPRGINSDIKVIGIDEKTLDEYGPIQTWSRERYAELVNKLNENSDGKPLLIGFDIMFSGNVDDGDDSFAKACEESGNVVVVNQLIYDDRLVENEAGEKVNKINDVSEPYKELADVTDIGFSNVSADSDGVVRRIKPVEQDYNMFSTVMYRKYCEITGTEKREIPTDKSGRSIINYSGKPGDFECVSMADMLDGKIDTRAFADSIVFVGAYAQGMQDNFKVPNGGSHQMYGVEVHANIFQSYLQNRFAVNGNPIVFGIIIAIIAMVLHFVFRKAKIWQSVILLCISIAVEVFVCVSLNNKGVSFNIVYLPLIAFLSFIYALGIHYLVEKARKQKVLNAFRKYVAPQIVEEISKKGDFSIKLGGENRDIAVLFVDIRGFTTMSEALEPETVVEILNEYLSLTTKSIFDNSGTLDKFVGDATMAVFNSPFELPDYEFKAVCAAMDIVKGGEELEKVLFEKYGRSVGFGVGVNCGPAVIGNVGCEFRMDFTAIGDTVNTAARLEANAKKGQVLISDEVYRRLKDRIKVKEVGELALKGKSKGFMVYEVVSVDR
ncbi:MAG: adenylate/guanylate cyclase domain-containing protein [Lachnospiraceae bacterium]|nr:adenylate/guanylate cyclase domain-containing protein [Lachnospiraceae bacterium]